MSEVSSPPLPVRREIAALGFACVFPTVMAWIYFVALATPTGTPRASEASPALTAAYSLGKVVQFSFPLVYLALFAPGNLRPRAPRFEGLALGLFFGAAVGVTMLIL